MHHKLLLKFPDFHKLTVLKYIYSVPAVNLDNIAIGVTDKDPDIIAWTNPGASLSIIILVASGVTSLGAKPVPPKTEILALWIIIRYNKIKIQWILK